VRGGSRRDRRRLTREPPELNQPRNGRFALPAGMHCASSAIYHGDFSSAKSIISCITSLQDLKRFFNLFFNFSHICCLPDLVMLSLRPIAATELASALAYNQPRKLVGTGSTELLITARIGVSLNRIRHLPKPSAAAKHPVHFLFTLLRTVSRVT
jgi:hypothetical protein